MWVRLLPCLPAVRTELPGGGTVTAEVSFAIDPDETGDYYIQYKPETLDAARGIWHYAVE